MHPEPSQELLELLLRLGLAGPEQVRAVRRRAQSLARELPLFDSVWVDALVAARLLTPFQAAEINAGRGDELEVEGYVLCEPLETHYYAQAYRARSIATREPARLILGAVSQSASESSAIDRALAQLREKQQRIACEQLVPLKAAGVQNGRLWGVCEALEGITAGEWLVRNGRFPPEVVLEIARQMAAGLAQLEHQGIVHGDLSAAAVALTPTGQVRFTTAGLRALLRSEEGYAHTDLAPEAYDYLAPERVADGLAPGTASDLYACGCLWWHLLTGRPPLAGGNSLAKLQAAQVGKISDVRLLAPETPAPLAAAIAACTQTLIARRPQSLAQLAASLGPSTRQGRVALAGCVVRRAPRQSPLVSAAHVVRHSRHTPVWTAATAGSLLMLAAISWPLWGPAITARVFPFQQTGDEHLVTTTGSKPPAELQVPHALPLDSREPEESELENEPAGAAIVPVAATQIVEDLILRSDRPIDGRTLPLRAGQLVRAADGQRATVVASPGWRITVDNVRFERIDFVAAGQPPTDSTELGAMLQLECAAVEFSACSFRAPQRRFPMAAIAAKAEDQAGDTDWLPAAVRLRLVDCALGELDFGIDLTQAGPVGIEVENTLYLGPGTLVRLEPAAQSSQRMLALRGCTVRNASLLELICDGSTRRAGLITVDAVESVFSPLPEDGLLRLVAQQAPDAAIAGVRWEGQGSLLTSAASFARWIDYTGRSHAVDDSRAMIDGLVTGEIEFAGGPTGKRRDSLLLRWSAPLRSQEPPGIMATR